MTDIKPPAASAGREEPDRAEALARQFHEAYERLAPSFGYTTREASAKPWVEVPEKNKRLMVAVCAELLTRSALAAERAAGAVDTARLDWMQEHGVNVEVRDSEELPIYVEASDDYRLSVHWPHYDIRAAIDAARALAADRETEGA